MLTKQQKSQQIEEAKKLSKTIKHWFLLILPVQLWKI